MRSRTLLETNFRQLSIGEVNKLVSRQPSSLSARLYSVLLSIFHSTGNTRDFHDEIANYIQLQQDRFATFRSRLSFLSDTAGALGLLGTVWGMFVTFFGGNLDSQRILNGMGLALVTTLIGLVVSIILNFCATEVFSVFNKRVANISAKADEFRLWLMALVHQRSKSKNGSPSGGGGSQKSQSVPKSGVTREGHSPKKGVTLAPISDVRQEGMIGHTIPQPLEVAVLTPERKGVAGIPVQFQVTEGGGRLANIKASAWIKTDERGIARMTWTLGSQVGPQRLRVGITDEKCAPVEFVAMAQPWISDLDNQETGMNNQSTNRGYIA
jgi:biopolymer transport protein ExbB/TolQ